MTINVRGLYYRAPDRSGSFLLRDINITLNAGQITLLIGRTGSGKSTLLHILSGIKVPSEGQVYVEDVPLWNRGKANGSVLSKLGHVYQYPEHQFFLPTVKRELQYWLKPLRLHTSDQERRVRDAILEAGLGETMLERSPFHLSGGEKRKAALASVLAVRPDWLVLDEPSSGLDSAFSAWLADRLSQMSKEKRTGGGIVIATHDLDLFLPIADSVVLVKNGEVMGQWTAAEAVRHPEWFEEAGVGVPACVRLARWTDIPGMESSRGSEEAGLSPAAAAERLALMLREYGVLQRSIPSKAPPPHEETTVIDSGKGDNPFAKLDPRSKWAVYLLFSIGVFLHPFWIVSGLGLLIALVLSAIAGMPVSKWKKALIPMAWFLMVSFVISGLELSFDSGPFSLAGSSFDWRKGFGSMERLAPLLPVMACGTVFAYSTSPMMIKKGLEAPLQAIPGFQKGAEAITLAVSLIFRFMQLIPSEMERFALLAAHRGQKGGKPGKLRIRNLPAFFTPLLLSVLQHAEDLSVAMESRGYGRQGVKRSNAAPLLWKPSDGAACLAGLCMGLLLTAVGIWWG